MTTLTMHPTIPDLVPGSEEWQKSISASKIPAILGVSPWDSPVSLWAKMTGKMPWEEGNAATEYGTYQEIATRAWFRDQHPELDLVGSQTFVHPYRTGADGRPSWTAAPDDCTRDGVIVEIKAARFEGDWDDADFFGIPEKYIGQVIWQLFCSNAHTCYIAVSFPTKFEFREYIIRREQVEGLIPFILDQVKRHERYMLEDRRPDWDGHDKTLEYARQIDAEIHDMDVQLPPSLGERFAAALVAEEQAKAELKLIKCQILDEMGPARRAWTPDGTKVADRRRTSAGTISLYAANGIKKTLTSIQEAKEAA